MRDRLLQLHGERQRHVGGGLGGQPAPDADLRDLREGGGLGGHRPRRERWWPPRRERRRRPRRRRRLTHRHLHVSLSVSLLE
jgi:hypothetical protein